MTKIKWYIGRTVCGLTVEGHAGFNPGNDIVCSAVSALVQTLHAGLEMRCHAKLKHEQRDGYFNIHVMVDEKNRDRINVLFDSIIFGLDLISKSYPDHVKIERI